MHTQTRTDQRNHWAVLIQEEGLVGVIFNAEYSEYICKTLYTLLSISVREKRTYGV
jgi:hypothetical protein